MTLPATTISAATLAAALLAAPLLLATSEPASASQHRRVAPHVRYGYVPPRRAYQPRRRNPYAEQRDDRCRTMPRAC